MRVPFRLLPIAAMVLVLWSGAAFAQVKFKRCLSLAELQGEQMVRHGIFLRESARRCNEITPGSGKLWLDFDKNFGARLKQQTDKRAKLFTREFKADALKVRTYFDGRLVTYHRNIPLTSAYCEHIDDMLTDLSTGGWGAFSSQSKVLANEVLLDYKACSN